MNHFILDLESILSYPELACYKSPEYKLHVSDHFFDKDLLTMDSRVTQSFFYFLEAVEGKGHAEKFSSQKKPIIKDVKPPGYTTSVHRRIDFYDVIKERFEVLTNEHSENAIIVSENANFKEKLSPKEALKKMKHTGVKDSELIKMTVNLYDDKILKNVTGFLLALCFIIIFLRYDFLFTYLRSIRPSYFGKIGGEFFALVGNIFSALLVIVTVWALFKMRSKRKLWYGFLEVALGIIVCSTVIFSGKVDFIATDYFSLFSGIYIVIRGLDNMEKGLNETHNVYLLTKWRRVF